MVSTILDGRVQVLTPRGVSGKNSIWASCDRRPRVVCRRPASYGSVRGGCSTHISCDIGLRRKPEYLHSISTDLASLIRRASMLLSPARRGIWRICEVECMLYSDWWSSSCHSITTITCQPAGWRVCYNQVFSALVILVNIFCSKRNRLW